MAELYKSVHLLFSDTIQIALAACRFEWYGSAKPTNHTC